MKLPPAKEYLGDGLYARIDGTGQIWLRAEDGIRVISQVALEPSVFAAFLDYARRLGAPYDAILERAARVLAEKGTSP